MIRLGNEHLLAIFLIIIFTFVVWGGILNQTLLGEGYYYFDSHQGLSSISKGVFSGQMDYDIFAKILFGVLPPIFGDNIFIYLLFQLLTFLTIYIILYLILYQITQSRILAFSAVVFFLTSYTGSFELMANGNYQRFVQRIPGIIIFLISFYMLHKFYDTKKIFYLFFSFLLFSLSIFLAHYITFLTPLMLIYPLVHSFSKKGLLTLSIEISLIFMLINLLITNLSPHKPPKSFIEHIQSEDQFIEKVLYQIPLVTFPQQLINKVGKNLANEKTPFLNTLKLFFILSSLIYLWGGVHLYRKEKKLFKLYISVFGACILSIVFYSYVDDKLNVLKGYDQDRHFFLPSLFIGILLSSILFKYPKILISLLTIYVIYNTYLIWAHMDAIQYKSEMMKRYVTYVRSQKSKFTDQSIVVTPSQIQWPNSFIHKFYGKKDMDFLVPSNDDWDLAIPMEERHNYFVFDYKIKYGSNREIIGGQVLDLTEKFRKGERFIFEAR